MNIDESRRAIWEEMQRQRSKDQFDQPELPLNAGGGDGTSGGMEARLAKLEASMEYVKADLGRLSGLPAESARIAERMTHLPTKAEMRSDIDTAADRAGNKMQRTVAIVGGLVTLAVAAINYLPKLIASN